MEQWLRQFIQDHLMSIMPSYLKKPIDKPKTESAKMVDTLVANAIKEIDNVKAAGMASNSPQDQSQDVRGLATQVVGQPAHQDLQTVDPSQIPETIKKYFPQDQWANAYRVMMGESGGRADAVGDVPLQYQQGGQTYGASYGPFQIRHLPGRPDPKQLLDPEFNAQYAADLFKRSGWAPWSAAKRLGIK